MYGAKHPTFEPATIQMMANAVDEAWTIMEANGDVGRQNPQEMKLALAKRVIELASSGDYDARTLRDTAVASLFAHLDPYRRRLCGEITGRRRRAA